MSVFKRGSVYWYEFCYNGHRVRESTRLKNKNAALRVETLRRGAPGVRKGGCRTYLDPFFDRLGHPLVMLLFGRLLRTRFLIPNKIRHEENTNPREKAGLRRRIRRIIHAPKCRHPKTAPSKCGFIFPKKIRVRIELSGTEERCGRSEGYLCSFGNGWSDR